MTVRFPTALSGGSTTPYVGRAALLDGLVERWRGAQAGAPGTVFLTGEPGVGKTRTAAELAERAHAEGALVLYGRCDEGLGAPYQPFVEALKWYVGDGRGDEAVGPLGRLPGELSRVVPALANFVGVPPRVVADPSSEEHRLFEAITSWALEAARAGNQGMVLVLDDLQWATKSTLLLTLHLVRAAAEAGAPLLLVGTYRDTDIDRAHPLFKALADLLAVAGVERVAVENLSTTDVLALMEVGAGHTLDAGGVALADALHAETEGNPFFVAEVLRHLVETDAIRRADDNRWVTADVATIAIPDGVREVVAQRVSRLSATTDAVLTSAAVQGREVDVDVLAALHEDGEAAVLDALDEATRARLVEETGPGHFRFAHALVHTTLYEDLTATRRSVLHRNVADALEKLRPSDVAALAFHYARARPDGGGLDAAVHYGLAAAEESLAARAFAEAEDRFTGVLGLLDQAGGAVPSAARIAALCGLGESQRDQGNAAFRETLLDASRRARELGDTDLLVRAVLANSRGMVSIVGGLDPERVEFIEVALDTIAPEPSADRARLIAQLASEVMFGDNHPRRLALCDEAEDMARQLDDKAVLAWVLARTGYAAVVPSRWEEFVLRSAEGVDLADATGDPSLRVYSRALYSGALLFAGRLEEAFEVSDAMVGIGDAECAPGERWVALVNSLPSWFVREGAVAAAAHNDACLAIAQDAGEADALQWWAAAGSGIFWLLGQGGDLADAAGVFAAQFPLSRVWLSGWAVMLVEGGRYDEARKVVEEHDLRRDAMEDFSMPLTGTQQLALLAFELDDAEIAATVVPVLEKYVGCWAHYFLFPMSPVTWGLAAAVTVLGDYDRAVALFEESLTTLLGVGFRDHAVHCRMGLARVLLRRGAPGDAARAGDLLADARAHAETIPAPRMVARIDALLA